MDLGVLYQSFSSEIRVHPRSSAVSHRRAAVVRGTNGVVNLDLETLATKEFKWS
jgi:hypothetical protein